MANNKKLCIEKHPVESAPIDDTTNPTVETKGSVKTKESVLHVPLDPSILKLVSQLDDPEANEDDDEEYHDSEHHLCRKCCKNYHVFCWCLCDVRRCSIAANILHGVTGICFMLMVLEPELMGIPDDEYDDDGFQEFIDMLSSGAVPRNSFGLAMVVVGSVGAYRFWKWPVLAMAIWYVIYLVWAMFCERYFSGIFAIFLLYPTIALFLALHHGRLTPENYATEGRCCGSLCHNNNNNNKQTS